MQKYFILLMATFLGWQTPLRAQGVDAHEQTVWLPGKTWALQFDSTGLVTKTNEIKADGRRYYLAEGHDEGAAFSIFLESAKTAPPPGECKHSLEEKVKRNASFSSSPLKGIRYFTSGDYEALEYIISDVDGRPINQKNVFGCLIREDAFIDIHISKVLFKERDQPFFDALFSSLKFVPNVPNESTPTLQPTGNSMQLFQEGSRLFMAHQYKEAIGPYRQAFEIEKVAPSLSKTWWRVLIDNLSIAYGITGDLTKSWEVLQYGVSKDPDYPLFYYNLACGTAEEGDVADTKKYLQLAFDRRKNVITGEKMPDPLTDDSFQKLLQQESFRKFVETLVAGK